MANQEQQSIIAQNTSTLFLYSLSLLSRSRTITQTKQLNKTKTITTCTDLYVALSNSAVSTIQSSSSPIVITPLDTTLGRYLAHQLVQIGVTDIFSVPGDGACIVAFTGGDWIDDKA